MDNKIAFLFPGQGSQYHGMGEDLVFNFQLANNMFIEASNILDIDFKKLCYEENNSNLNNTEYTQPAIYLISIILFKLLEKKGIKPHAVAGHSLGEYSALTAAKVISFKDGLKLVRKRGIFMNEALSPGKGSMAAIIGLDINEIKEICIQISGICEIANYNTPRQIVISGEKIAIIKALELAKNYGAKRAIELEVSGPFHSSLMQSAKNKLEEELNKINFNKTEIDIVPNVIADYAKTSNELKCSLIEQLDNSVLWVDSMNKLINSGIDTFIEVGPGKVLKGLMRRINKKVKVYSINSYESYIKYIDILSPDKIIIKD